MELSQGNPELLFGSAIQRLLSNKCPMNIEQSSAVSLILEPCIIEAISPGVDMGTAGPRKGRYMGRDSTTHAAEEV